VGLRGGSKELLAVFDRLCLEHFGEGPFALLRDQPVLMHGSRLHYTPSNSKMGSPLVILRREIPGSL
jgi:hypothetical protein